MKQRNRSDSPWRAEFTIGDVRFFAILGSEELPQIGYEIPGYVQPDTPPVPVRTLQPTVPA